MIRKKKLNKRAVIIASSIAAIPLTAMLIAAATNRIRRKSLQTSGLLLGQTKSKRKSSSIITTATHTQQQKEKPQAQSQPPWQESGTKKTEERMTLAATVTSTNTVVDGKDITNTVGVSSTMVPSSTSDSTVIVSPIPSPQTSKEEEISFSDEARKAGESLKELVVTAIKEAKDSASGTGKQLKEQTIDIAATADSKDIHSLEDNVSALVSLF